MTETTHPGIYLIVNFNWPNPFEQEHGKAAYALHTAVQGQTWIREAVAASGGVGGQQSSIWIFWLENYGALDRLLNNQEDKVCQAYNGFFNQMESVQDYIRGEVYFA